MGALRALCFLALATAEPVRVAYLHNSLPLGGVETHIVSQSAVLTDSVFCLACLLRASTFTQNSHAHISIKLCHAIYASSS